MDPVTIQNDAIDSNDDIKGHFIIDQFVSNLEIIIINKIICGNT